MSTAYLIGGAIGGVAAMYLLVRVWMLVLSAVKTTWQIRLLLAIVFSWGTGVMLNTSGGGGANTISTLTVGVLIAGALEAFRCIRAARKYDD